MPLRALLLLPLCFPGLQAQTPHAEEERLEGSSLSIECPYTAYTYYQYQKAWCRLREGQWELLVEINPTQYSYTTRASKGKVTIEDNPRRGTLSITMTNLQTEDSGTYSCALRSPYEYYPLQTISLNVFKELHKMELDSLSVQCPYGKLGYSTGRKAWCQREGRTGCKVLVSTDHYPSTRSNSKALGDRAFIQDDTQNRSVTITMEKLQVEDTGVYWCALDTYRAPTRIMEVRLSVSKSEYLLAATWAWWHISASPPSRPAPPHRGAQCCPCTPDTHLSLPVCLSAGHSGGGPRALWSHGSGLAHRARELLPAETHGRFPSAPTNGAPPHDCFPRATPGAPGAPSPPQHRARPRWALLETSPTARHCSCSGPATATRPWSLPPKPCSLRACQRVFPWGTRGRGQDTTQFVTPLCTSKLGPVPFCCSCLQVGGDPGSLQPTARAPLMGKGCRCGCFGISPNVLGVFQGPNNTQPRSWAPSLSTVHTMHQPMGL
ncbi:uncharacterized protein VSU04_013670 [Chlamydotis macqueenii]